MTLSNTKNLLVGCLLSAITSTASATLPSQITFTNETPLALSTSIAGIPGNGIASNVTAPVSYTLVAIGCSYAPNYQSCPIEFTDSATGQKVATVTIDSSTATLTGAPVLYGHYASEYEVLGWESSPIEHITISKRA